MSSKYKAKRKGSTVRPSLVNKTFHDYKRTVCSVCRCSTVLTSDVGKICYCGGFFVLEDRPIIY